MPQFSVLQYIKNKEQRNIASMCSEAAMMMSIAMRMRA